MNRSGAAILSEIVPHAIRLLDRELIWLLLDLENAYDADLAGDYAEVREQLVVVALRLGIRVRRLYHDEEAANPEFSSGAQPCRYCDAGELRAERWSPPVQVQEGAAAVLPASNGWIAVRPANDSFGAETAVFVGNDDGDAALWDALRWIADAWGARPSGSPG